MRTLRTTADRIGATDLSQRLPVTGNDDITALTLTVNGMLDRLESAFVSQRQFLDDAGHELGTPLTVLSGNLELLDSARAEEVEATRQLLLDEVRRMARLTRDLILLAKSERPDFLRIERVDCCSTARNGSLPLGKMGDRLQVHRHVDHQHRRRAGAQRLRARREPHAHDRRTTLAAITEHGP